MSPLADLNVKVARGLDLAALLLFFSISISPGLDPSAMPLHVEFIIIEPFYWSLFSCKTQPGLVKPLHEFSKRNKPPVSRVSRMTREPDQGYEGENKKSGSSDKLL